MAHIKISRGNVTVYENTWTEGQGNITSLAAALRNAQEVSNKVLTRLIEEEKSSNNNSERKSGVQSDDNEDEDSDEDEADDQVKCNLNEEEAGKRGNMSLSNNAKKFCPDQ